MKESKEHKIVHFENNVKTVFWSKLMHKEVNSILIFPTTEICIGDKISISDESNFWFVRQARKIEDFIGGYKLITF